MKTLKVSSHSEVCRVAGAIAHELREHGQSELVAIGAGAVNQTVKGLALAHHYLTEEGRGLECRPRFDTFTINGEERTGITFDVRMEAAP